MPTELPPEQLLARIAEFRDKEAFAELFDFFAPRIKAFLMRGGSTSEAAAEELTQEALLTVWRKAGSYSAQRGSAAAWIYTIARNLRIDEARRSKRAKLYEAVDDMDQLDPEQPDDLLSASEHAARVRDAMTDLPEEQLEVVRWSFVEGAPHSEIAERLDLPLGTVKSRLRLAMRRMRKSLEDLA